MKTPQLEFCIEEIVVDGVAGVTPERLAEAVQSELERVFLARGIPNALLRGREITEMAGSVEPGSGSAEDRIASGIARVIGGGLQP